MKNQYAQPADIAWRGSFRLGREAYTPRRIMRMSERQKLGKDNQERGKRRHQEARIAPR